MAIPMEQPRYTFADLLTWDDSAHYELIDGEAYMMAPPLRVHQEISGELYWQIASFLRGKPCKVYAAPFAVRPFADETEDTVVEPDITVVCDSAKLDRYGCKGAPDMVIEILSPSTRHRDLSMKYRLYQRAGVREYWIVDPDRRAVQTFRLDDGFYDAAEVYTSGAVPVSLWDDFSIDLSSVFPNEPNER